MKQKLKQTQKMKQNLRLNQKMEKSLDILKMNEDEIRQAVSELVMNNPAVELKENFSSAEIQHDWPAPKKNLKEELYYQLNTLPGPELKDGVRKSAAYIIESLDKNGFYNENLEEAAEEAGFEAEDLQKALDLIQKMEPAGVGTKNSLDAVLLQLKISGQKLPFEILISCQEDLLGKNYANIAQKLHISKKTVEEAVDQIRRCSLFPCSDYYTEPDSLISPDLYVEILDDHIHITSAGSYLIGLNETMAEDPVLKSYFNEARYFIDDLNRRNQTLLMCANVLFTIQENHFLFHDELNPCSLKDIALKTGFHESTVSRTLSNKYYSFQDEIYPVKNLFVSQTTQGTSRDAVLKMIALLVKQEDPESPWTDEELVEQLEQMELYVSRRTLTKYRGLLGIPSVKKRKKKQK